MFLSKPLTVLCLLSFSFTLWAESKPEFDAIRKAIEPLAPGIKLDVSAIRPTPLKDIFEVTVGAQVMYVSSDGQFLLDGNLVDLKTRRNLTAPRVFAARAKVVDNIGESNMIIFSPAKDKIKHTITVFTDIDCAYCRLMHSQMADYMKQGIRVRYLLYPRAEVNTPTFNKAISVWCSTDRNAALTKAKSGSDVEAKTCANPVQEHVGLGTSVGVTGTPSILKSDGQLLPGYVPPAELVKLLDKQKQPEPVGKL